MLDNQYELHQKIQKIENKHLRLHASNCMYKLMHINLLLEEQINMLINDIVENNAEISEILLTDHQSTFDDTLFAITAKEDRVAIETLHDTVLDSINAARKTIIYTDD